MAEFNDLNVGQRVRWSSHANSNTATKTGRIVWLNGKPVPYPDQAARPLPDMRDGTKRFDRQYPSFGVLVKVERFGTGGKHLQPYYYGPRPKHLTIAGGPK